MKGLALKGVHKYMTKLGNDAFSYIQVEKNSAEFKPSSGSIEDGSRPSWKSCHGNDTRKGHENPRYS